MQIKKVVENALRDIDISGLPEYVVADILKERVKALESVHTTTVVKHIRVIRNGG